MLTISDGTITCISSKFCVVRTLWRELILIVYFACFGKLTFSASISISIEFMKLHYFDMTEYLSITLRHLVTALITAHILLQNHFLLNIHFS